MSSPSPIPLVLEAAVRFGWTWEQTRQFILDSFGSLVYSINFKQVYDAYCVYMNTTPEKVEQSA